MHAHCHAKQKGSQYRYWNMVVVQAATQSQGAHSTLLNRHVWRYCCFSQQNVFTVCVHSMRAPEYYCGGPGAPRCTVRAIYHAHPEPANPFAGHILLPEMKIPYAL